MLVTGKIEGAIPSPSLHLLGADAGFKAFQFSASSDEHAASQQLQCSGVNCNKDLPDIPIQIPGRLGLIVPSSRQPLHPPVVNQRYEQKRPYKNVMRALTGVNTARALLEAASMPKSKHSNSITGSELSFTSSDITEVINVSPTDPNEELKLLDKSSPLVTPTKSSRRGPPAPIHIPNGRMYTPAVVLEREPDLAELERHISTSVKAPRSSRKSLRRSKPREHPKQEAKNAPSVPTRNSTGGPRINSTLVDGDGNITETSNDEFRFSLGFLLQPERGSVMTTRTGRADSATLPELSPFLDNDNYIPPVPTIPPSLRTRGTSEGSGSTPLAKDLKRLRPLQNPLLRSVSPNPGSSPLASAYSQLTANSRPHVPQPSQAPQHQRMSEVVTEYSPVFTAASPLESPNKEPCPALTESTATFIVGKESPIVESLARSPLSTRSPTTRDIPSTAIETPDTSSSYSTATPELSPAPKPKPTTTDRSSSTPESISYSSHEVSSGIFESVKPLSMKRSATFSQSSSYGHRELPKSAVPMSAISSGASTASLERPLDAISFVDRHESVPSKSPETVVADLATLVKRNPVLLHAFKPIESTFAPNHSTILPPAVPLESRKLRFPPLHQPLNKGVLHSEPRQRRPSLPSPVTLASPVGHERRPSAPSPLTGGPILFTPSSHQSLQAAMSTYSSSGRLNSSFKNAGKRPQAIDDIVVRNPNLSIRTDHLRSAPRQGLVPYTPFSQGSDVFTPTTSILADQSAKAGTGFKSAPPGTLSTSASIRLATRARTRPPSGPRKPRNSSGSKKKANVSTIPEKEGNPITGRSRAGTDAQLALSPSTPSFETQLVRFRGLTLDVAKWTFTQEELQEISRRAICQSADPFNIRLLPARILDTDIPSELENLELQREELKANYKYQHKSRLAVLNSLSALAGTLGAVGAQTSTFLKLIDELKDIGTKADQYSEELYRVCDQIAQLRALQDSHSTSALAIALRKINASFIKMSAEMTDIKNQVGTVTTEREEAWAMADGLERELNLVKHQLDQERGQRKLMSPPARRVQHAGSSVVAASEDVQRSGSRVLAARRRSKASIRPPYSVASPQPFPALLTNGSIQSASLYTSLGSAYALPPLPSLNSAKATQLPFTAQFDTANYPPNSARSNLHSQRSASFSGTPSSSCKALINAQNELLQILGVPVQGMTGQGFRRTRSFSDAGARASMLPASPPVADINQAHSPFHHRESRITSFYGSYLSRHNIAGGCMHQKRRTRASQWDMEAIYDGILDDPDTLFAVIKPGL